MLLSGTKLRKALSEGEPVSEKFSRPEVLKILRAYYAGIAEEDKVEIKMSGHSAA
jgi:sulfate adenylyltransferase